MLKNILFIALLGISHVIFSQESTYQQAEDDFANGQLDRAYEGYKSAGLAYKSQQDYKNYAACNLKMAQCHLSSGKADLSVQLAESSLSFINEIEGEIASLQASAFGIIGEGYLNLGRNDLALEYLSKEEAFYSDIESLETANCFENLGIAYGTNENTTTALAYHERSLNIKEKLLDEDDPAIADSYNNIGLIYLKDQHQKAITQFNKALAIYQGKYGDIHPKVANCYSNLAYANSEQGKYGEALQYLDLVMEIWESSFEGDHPNKAFTLSQRGRILEKDGILDEALHFQQLALHQYLRIYGNKHPEVANAYYLIGTVYQEKGKFKLAVEHLQASIYANLVSQEYESIYDLPELKEYYNADILLYSLQKKAIVLEALHYEKTLKPKDLISSLNTYALFDELITQIRQLRLSEADKLRLGAISNEVYDNGIRIALELSNRTWNKRYYLDKAFEFCERSKSAILLEAIQETKAKSFSGIPEKLLSLEDSLKTEISYLKQKLANAKGEDQGIKLDLFNIEQSYRTFIDQLEKDYSSYFNLKYNQNFATSSDLQKAMGQNSAILSYFTGADNIYVFSITKKNMNVTSIPKSEDFFQVSKAFRNSIKYDVFKIFETSSLKLYKQLIPNIKPDINHLIILPDGVLGTLPFEAFTLGIASERTGYGQLTYLVEKYAISYDYAATLLLDRLNDTESTDSKGILLTAPITFSENEVAMPDLPGSQEEINEIKYLFLSTDQKPTVSLGKNANETMIKREKLHDYKYLHFATHGMVDESNPELSRIFLSPSDTDDGSLYSGEIYNLKINADLVTLSACETGLGKLAKGEGIVGLSRSLMYAGAHNLIVSLWQVADASTAQLMIDFYKQHLHHSDNNLFNDDLRKAKLNLLHSENYSSPYYWAPFILVGD
ncbi:MAG: CHAT domain-containing protein [Cyclobacteriaceae bacterium]